MASLKPFSLLALSLRPGDLYEHYKQKRYQILGVARHSETLEELVVYRALYGDQEIWVRPLGMFLEELEIDGTKVARFRKV